MANLLPLDAQKNIWNTERSRFFILASSVSLVTSVICALALAPAYVVLFFSQIQSPQQVEKMISAADMHKDSDALAAAQSLLQLMPALSRVSTTTDALISALSMRPKGITVDHVTFSPGSSGALILSGLVDTRESINAYRAALDSDERFSSVNVPVSDLVNGGGRFTITIRGAF